MNFARITLAGAVTFCRVPLGQLANWPKAARRVYEQLHYLARKGNEIDVTVGQLCEACGVMRRCITKGLRQLEELGIIERDKCMAFGRRIIRFLVKFVGDKKKKQSGGAKNADAKADAPAPVSRPEKAENIQKGMLLLGWQPKLKESGEMGWYKVEGIPNLDWPAEIRPELKEYYDDIRARLIEESRPCLE